MRVNTSEQIRQIEQNAVDTGMDFLRLMENSGSACAKAIRTECKIESSSQKNICIVCGRGKNGGDGFVIARKLFELGINVSVILLQGNPNNDDSNAMLIRIRNLGITVFRYDIDYNESINLIKNADIIVDCIFGIGFYGTVNHELAAVMGLINSSKAYTVSIDIPSGLYCDNNKLPSVNILADLTIAISSLKPVHILVPAAKQCGKTVVAEIGIPDSFFTLHDEFIIDAANKSEIKSLFKKRDDISHKGSFGHVLSICGSLRYQGAAVLAANGAVYSGAGLVTAAFPDCAYPAIASKLTEPLMLPLPSCEDGTLSFSGLQSIYRAMISADVILFGCGLSISRDIFDLLHSIIKEAKCPVIIDADGINNLCNNIDILREAEVPVILTPHPGELSRLCGIAVDEIQNNRIETAIDFADKYGVTLVLKGANTVVASGHSESIFVNTTGNPGMAVGGSGDLLSGIIASFIAQGMSPVNACKAAVYIHGLCGDITAEKLSMLGLTPTACLEQLPVLLSEFE